MSFTRYYIFQNDSVPQGNGQEHDAAQDSAAREAARKKRKKREEERKKKKEEQEARKKQKQLEQASRDSIAKAKTLTASNTVKAKSLQPADTTRDTSAAASLFTGHELQPRFREPEPVPHAKPTSLWLFALLFTAYAIYVSLRVLYSKRFRQEVSAFFTSRTISQMMREEYALSNRVSIGLSMLFLLLFSLFLYQVFAYFGYFGVENFTGPQFFIRVCGVVIIAFAFKLLMIRILGVVFKVEGAVNEYIFNIFLHHKALGMFLFPVTIALAFIRDISPRYLIMAGWSIVALVLVYRTVRVIFGGIQTAGISKYYLFLYLCTLEILPLIVIIKVFISQT